MEPIIAPPTPKVVKSDPRGSNPGERRGGRKAGVPNKATGEVRDLARIYGPDAIKAAAKLAGLVLDKETRAPDGMAISEQARIAALGMILDRAYGRATQVLAGPDGDGPIKHVLEVVWGESSESES